MSNLFDDLFGEGFTGPPPPSHVERVRDDIYFFYPDRTIKLRRLTRWERFQNWIAARYGQVSK